MLPLAVENLHKSYGGKVAVEKIDLSVKAGEIVALLGPNGAGKTTTINMILGVLAPDRGRILLNGLDLKLMPSNARAATNFAAVYAPLPGNLTVRQNLRVFGLLYDVKHLKKRTEKLIDMFHLQPFIDTKCGLLSSGEQTRVALAKAMLNEPSLLLLDEPTASLDPATAAELRHHIRDYAKSTQTGVLWTSHNMAEVEAVCDRVLFMAHGSILLEGDPRTLPAEHGEPSLEALFIRIAKQPLGTGGNA